MWDLVGNPEDRFSHDVARIVCWCSEGMGEGVGEEGYFVFGRKKKQSMCSLI